jgi:hypothetical protein
MAATSNGLMGTAEKGPVETKDAREERFLKQVKEQSAYFRNAERDHYGQTNPRCRLNAFRLWERECGREGFHSFFSGVSWISGMSI